MDSSTSGSAPRTSVLALRPKNQHQDTTNNNATNVGRCEYRSTDRSEARNQGAAAAAAAAGELYRLSSTLAETNVRPLSHCVIAQNYEVLCRLKIDCHLARDRLRESMGHLFASELQTECGGFRRRLPVQNATSLGTAVIALLTFTAAAGRLFDHTRGSHQEPGRDWDMPAPFRSVLQLFNLVKWHSVHRAIDALQSLRNAWEEVASGDLRRWNDGKRFLSMNAMGMLGCRYSPGLLDAQNGAGMLAEGLYSLMVLAEVDWRGFGVGDVEEKMRSRSTEVHIVKHHRFPTSTFDRAVSYLGGRFDRLVAETHSTERFTEGYIHPAHVEMMKGLDWVEITPLSGDYILRMLPES